jgi:hypothetical protein
MGQKNGLPKLATAFSATLTDYHLSGPNLALESGRFVHKGRTDMVERKSVLKPAPSRPELQKLLADSVSAGVSDEQLREQRVSFAYGNAPEGSRITKESARHASNSIKMKYIA